MAVLEWGVVNLGVRRVLGAFDPSFLPQRPMRARVNALLVVLMVVPWQPAASQSSVRDSVLATIERVFDAMRARDTTGLRAVFDSTARFISVPDSSTRPARSQTVLQFLTGTMASSPDSALDERIYDPEVRIEGPIAQVWTYYTFRRGKTFSHCGIDAVTLMRAAGAWKIVNWIWTVRRTGCTRTA